MHRILTFTTLFPNAEQPNLGIFVENRLKFLLRSQKATARVVAPIGYFPFRNPIFGDYAARARVPRQEMRDGVTVDHPRYPVIPKVGMNLAARLLYRGARGPIQRFLEQGNAFDLIDAHYFYPDGVAAMHLAAEFNLPFVITARGTDIHTLPQYPAVRRQILEAAEAATAVVTVCQALKDRLVELGANSEKIRVIRNGVDLEAFHPLNRKAARTALGLRRPTLASVGNLIELKGHHLVIEALTELPGLDLLIVGTGPEQKALESLVESRGLSDRVRFMGRLPYDQMVQLFSAVDLTVLASSREGWANVLLESMACGTPVAATDVWGTREVVTEPSAGRLIPERGSDAIANTIRQLLATKIPRADVRRYAEKFSWDETTAKQLALFDAIRNSDEAL